MFTGIINSQARVKKIALSKSGAVLRIEKPKTWKIKTGDSISINGVCSTVVKQGGGKLVFEYMPESLQRSNLGGLRTKDVVNLEQSLRPADRLDGHIVQGHVDTVGTVSSVRPEGNSKVITITLPPKPARAFIGLVAEKGSIAVEGVSLTVAGVKGSTFSVKIIPHTWQHTNLHTKTAGRPVNLEFDVLAKYLQRLLKTTHAN